MGVLGQLLNPPRRPLQERHRAHQNRMQAGVDRRTDAVDQPHVVEERQPRDHRGVSGRHPAVVGEVVGHHLFEVGDDVAVGDHHAGRHARGTRRVLQVRRSGTHLPRRLRLDRCVEVQCVDFHDAGRRATDGGRVIPDDVGDRRRREYHRRRGVAQRRRHPLVVRRRPAGRRAGRRRSPRVARQGTRST